MISIVIPAFNEEQNIPRIRTELIPVMERIKVAYEILIVDDGSRDRTVQKVNELMKKSKRIRLLKHGINKGLGHAVRTGIVNAKGDAIVMLDADFTFHPREIPKLYDEYVKTGYDCIIGSHFGEGGKTEDIPIHRLILSRIVNLLYSLLLGQKISSISSIFRVYKASAVKKLKLESGGFDINAEILARMLQNKALVAEVPVTLTSRKFGTSKIKITKEMKSNFKLLWKILFWKIGFR